MDISKIEEVLDTGIVRCSELEGGMIGEVYQLDLEDGRTIAAKVGETSLDIETKMLKFLNDESNLPVPEVYHSSEDLILMEYIEGDPLTDEDVEKEAAEYLAELHSITGERFGFDYDTLTGPVVQPNDYSDSWVDFFKENRLIYMAEKTLEEEKVSRSTYRRIIKLSECLDEILTEPEGPSLIHGDIWKTNIIVKDGGIKAFLDPAIYFAHPEIELAYISFTDTFDEGFFHHYDEISGIEEGFFEERCDVYNLYPLLVHAYIFGEDYPEMIRKKLDGMGF